MTDALHVLIADDHPLFRGAIGEALSTAQPDIVIDQADSLATTLSQLEQRDTDLLLLDLNMPGNDGLMGLLQIRSQYPEVAVAVVSANEAGRTMDQARAAGALGYVPKSLPLDSLVSALSSLLKGVYWFPEGYNPDSEEHQEDLDAIAKLATLTPQQQRVLALITRGFLNKQIAFELNVKETTIKTHVSEIFRKLGIYNRTQAALFSQYLEVPE
ncbi:MAG: response regulator [Saccharospirillum sp.]